MIRSRSDCSISSSILLRREPTAFERGPTRAIVRHIVHNFMRNWNKGRGQWKEHILGILGVSSSHPQLASDRGDHTHPLKHTPPASGNSF